MSKEPNRVSTQDDPGYFFGKTIQKLTGPDVHDYWPMIPDDIGPSDITSQLSSARLPYWGSIKSAQIVLTANSIGLSGTHAVLGSGEEISTDYLTGETARPNLVSINVSDNISLTGGSNIPSGVADSSRPSRPANPRIEVRLTGSEERGQPGNVAPSQETSWVEQLSWLLPKEIGEAFLGDLLEKRERMAAKGCSRRRIECFSLGQIILSIAYRVLQSVGKIWMSRADL